MSMKNFKNGRLYRDPEFITFYFHADADLTRKCVSIRFRYPRNPHIFVSTKYYSESESFDYGFSVTTAAARNFIRDCMKQLTL